MSMKTTIYDGYEIMLDPINHHYIVNGKKVYSISFIIDTLCKKPYKKVPEERLEIAKEKGQNLKTIIFDYEKDNITITHPELTSYKALKKQHQFDILALEKVILLRHQGHIIAAGTLAMLVRSPFIKGLGIAMIKRSQHLDEERLKLQLNLYKLGYEQTFKKRINYLKCIHIRHRYYNYVDVSIDTEFTKRMLDRFIELYPIY